MNTLDNKQEIIKAEQHYIEQQNNIIKMRNATSEEATLWQNQYFIAFIIRMM